MDYKQKVIIKKDGPYRGQTGEVEAFLGSMGTTVVVFEDGKSDSFTSEEFVVIEEMTKERALELADSCIEELLVFDRLSEITQRLLEAGFTIAELVHYFNFDADDVLNVAEKMEEEENKDCEDYYEED